MAATERPHTAPPFGPGLPPRQVEGGHSLLDQGLRYDTDERDENAKLADKPLLCLSHESGSVDCPWGLRTGDSAAKCLGAGQ